MDSITVLAVLACIIIGCILLFSHIEKKRKIELKMKKAQILEEFEQDELYQNKLIEIQNYHRELTSERTSYLIHAEAIGLKNKYYELRKYFWGLDIPDYVPGYQAVSDFLKITEILDSLIDNINTRFVNSELNRNSLLFSNIDGKSLDEQQRRAVVTDEQHNLILAGAGSGKTLTIAGKCKYLCDVKGVLPKDILLISFTRKAAEEMTERIKVKLKIDVNATTFHKLGLQIISKAKGGCPEIINELSDIVGEYFNEYIVDNSEKVKQIMNFFTFYLVIPEDYEKYDSLGEYYEQQRTADYETLKSKYERDNFTVKTASKLTAEKKTFYGEKVKSIEEAKIANFMFLNGVKYEYERPYPYDTGDQNHRRYQPDFYLPDYDLYLEHFGVNREGKVPWLSNIEEKKYLEGIQWKRRLHQKHGTQLLETYSYYNSDGVLIEKLDEIMRLNGVEYHEVDFKEVYERIYAKKSDCYFKEFIKLVTTFIELFKSNGFGVKDFELLKNNSSNSRNEMFLDIVKPTYEYYQKILQECGGIDFNDMINLATEYLESNKVKLNYKYVIIDEYQDISASRYRLVKVILAKTGAKLMCVGDDWQSIYRFAGSDIALFTEFEKCYGFSEILRIEKTYRNSQELIDVAGTFVMKNPEQFRKSLASNIHLENPVHSIRYQENPADMVAKVLNEIALSCGENKDVMLIGRTKYDFEIFSDHADFIFKKGNKGIQDTIVFVGDPNLSITCYTAHKSKGLESSNVIILNLENKLLGFPSKISDDPLLYLVLNAPESYPFAEERRLLYVAMTRAKQNTYLMVSDKRPSIFITELEKLHNVICTKSTNTLTTHPHCPRCKTGFLLERTAGDEKTFVGCSNYPLCGYSVNDTAVLTNPHKCPICNGYIIMRKGPYGPFWSCSNFPTCTFTSSKV